MTQARVPKSLAPASRAVTSRTPAHAPGARGQPLSAATRAAFEPRFGHDFAHVRVHTDAAAARAAESRNALAYTLGADIAFAAGHYEPETPPGRSLLAHELTHVVQQTSPLPRAASAVTEAEADVASRAVAAGRSFRVRHSSALTPAAKPAAAKARKVEGILVSALPPLVVFHIAGEKTPVSYRMVESTIPPSTKPYLVSVEVSEQGGQIHFTGLPGKVLFDIEGAPDPASFSYPATLPLRVGNLAPSLSSGADAGPGSGLGAELDPTNLLGGALGPRPGEATSPASATPTGATPTSAPAEGEIAVPEIVVDDVAQIAELEARGLLDASTARGLKSKLEKKEPLSFEQAVKLLDALGRAVVTSDPEQSKQAAESWLAWAEMIEAQGGVFQGKSGTTSQGLSPEAVKAILAKSKEFAGVENAPAQSAKDAHYDPERQKSWSGLAAWEKLLWTEYLKKHGAAASPLENAKTDLKLDRATRLGMALRLSVAHVDEGVRKAWGALVDDPMFKAGLLVSIGTYLFLWLAPEPLFTKAAAILTTLAILSFAAFSAQQIIALARAWSRLEDEAGSATTLAELEEAARHFGEYLGAAELQLLLTLASVLVGKLVPPGGGQGLLPPPQGGLALAGAGGRGAMTTATASSVKVLADGTIVIVGPTLGMAMSMQGNGGTNDDAVTEESEEIALTDGDITVVDPGVAATKPPPVPAQAKAKPPPIPTKAPAAAAVVPAVALAPGSPLPNLPGYTVRGVARLGGKPVHDVVVIETPEGDLRAFYRRSGMGNAPGQPKEVDAGGKAVYGQSDGDWVPLEGAATTLSGIDLVNVLRKYGIRAETFNSTTLPKTTSGNTSAATLFETQGAKVQSLGGDIFVLKPRAGNAMLRPGQPAEAPRNSDVSSALQQASTEFPGPSLDARAFNEWLRKLGVKVGGNYEEGEILFDDAVITTIP